VSDGRDVRGTVEAVWRIEAPRLIASLTRFAGDVATAEDLAQDALLAALEQWPERGIPDNPGAWLMTAAKRRAIDLIRRSHMLERKHTQLGADGLARQIAPVDFDRNIDDPVGDDLLGLMFMACHPVLSAEARVALTLRLLGGLTTEEIARAYLTSTPTVAQRIVRAKRTLAEAHVPFEVPRNAELTARLPAVLSVIYLIFNEGYSATSGEEWFRADLCHEALRLGRMVAELAPDESEAHGLVALMEFQASRLHARRGPGGEPVLLPDQDRSRWDRLLIQRGITALRRAGGNGTALGPYALQAAIAACHATALSADDTDWERIVALYDALAQVAPSPVVELNRAVAVAMAFGPAAGLELVDALQNDAALRHYHLLPAVRGDLLKKPGRLDEARAEFERAAAMTDNARERALLLRRAAE
jgi:RNA polymerase sigma factor (sigma-70 family)